MIRLRAISFIAFCAIWWTNQGYSEEATLSAGHALGPQESQVAAQLLQQAAEMAGIKVNFLKDTTDLYGVGVKDRFTRREGLTDLVFTYVGQTEQLHEITGLASSGKIRPLDSLPSFDESVEPQDIYQNLLDPVTFDGHLWAVPIRVCPPHLVARKEVTLDLNDWDVFVQQSVAHGFVYMHKGNLYMLWRTIAAANSDSNFNYDYDFSKPCYEIAFKSITQLQRASGFRDWKGKSIGLAVPDDYFGVIGMKEKTKAYVFPGAIHHKILSRENSWYLSISDRVIGDKAKAAAAVLHALLSTDMQVRMSRETLAPPVRPSVTTSASFQEAFPQDSVQRVLAQTLPRLQDRMGGAGNAEAESIVEEAFSQAVASPDRWLEIMMQAGEQAQEVLRHSTK